MKRFAYLFVLALLLQAAFSSCEKEDKTEKTVAVESVSLDQPYLDLMIGETATLKATVLPYHATKKKVTWSSSAPEVASVSGYGQVKALKGPAPGVFPYQNPPQQRYLQPSRQCHRHRTAVC